jgi:nitrous oxide reductase
MGKPTPDVSDVSAAGQPSGQQVDMDALADKVAGKIIPKFEDMARRSAQSVFDKKAYQFDKMAEYLKAAGGDPKKAARDMALDQIAERELSRQDSEPVVPGKDKGEDGETRTARFLNDLKDESGVELSDEELKQIWSGKRYTNYDDAYKDARKAAWKKVKQANIGAGAAASTAGESPAAEETDDEIVAKYEKAVRTPSSTAAELKRLTGEAKKRGLLK